ncbi:hypothetical protein ABZ379_05820 [Streptomyces canus]|uniref:hypothetical protein n=1 Tax=Streptomyces canus TaxID=58343 RepID=UPI0033F454E6
MPPAPPLPARAPRYLTPKELDVATQLVAGASNEEGGIALGITPGAFSGHLGRIGAKFGAFSRPERAHALLSTGQVPPPPAPSPAPPFDATELRLIHALAKHSDPVRIASAAGIAKSEVRALAEAVATKAKAKNTTHLIGLCHTWKLLDEGGADADGSRSSDTIPAHRMGPVLPPKPPADRIRVGFLNSKDDGGPELAPGVLPILWHDTYDLLVALHFDWLGLGELTYSQTRTDATDQEKRAAEFRWREAQKKTEMRGFRAAMGQGRNPTGLLVRPSTFTIGPCPQQHLTKVFRTPPTVVELGLREVPKARILTASLHASYCNPFVREAEAYELTALVDKVKTHLPAKGAKAVACWLLGDFNELPVPSPGDVPDIDWNAPELTDMVHRLHRAREQPDGTWCSRTDVDKILLHSGMHDPARYAARRLGNPAALATATAGHADSAVGQGGPCRIDRAAVDGWSIQAVTDVQVVPMGGRNDHDLLIVDFSRSKLTEGLRRKFQPLAPWALMS